MLHRAHGPRGAQIVWVMTMCMSQVRMFVTGDVFEIADSRDQSRVMDTRRDITKIPQDVPSVCWVVSHTVLIHGRVLGVRW